MESQQYQMTKKGRKIINETGNRYNKLLVVREDGRIRNKVAWLCHCDCGNYHRVEGDVLRRGGVQSCGCWRKEVSKRKQSLEYGKSSMNSLIAVYKKRATKMKLDFELKLEDCLMLFTSNCFYCGIKPQQIRKSSSHCNGVFIYNGIDRIDNTKGYIHHNIVPCCKRCNTAKSDMSYNEFVDMCKRVAERHIEVKQNGFSNLNG